MTMHRVLVACLFALLTLTLNLTLTLTATLTPHSTHISNSLSLYYYKHEMTLLSLSYNRAVLFALVWCTLVALLSYISTRPHPVLLLGYSCYRPDNNRKLSVEVAEYFGNLSGRFSDESADFMRAIYSKSGLGNETYAPPFTFFTPGCDERHQYATEEAEEGMFSTVSSLLAKTNVHPSQITIVIVAASTFTPAPSLTSHLVHRFRLPPTVRTFNLAGMGCSAGALMVDLATRLLRRRGAHEYALVVTTDSMGLNWYYGNDRHMLVTNCIFRVGTAAALLTNDPARRCSAKMELIRTLRTHHGAEESSYNAAIQQEDELGNVGIRLSRNLIRAAGAALRDHVAALAPLVLPVSELVRYGWAVARTYVAGDRKMAAALVPDFGTAFEHMCIHAGGKAVINGVGKLMKLSAEVTEAARMSLHRFGNTSSSLVFYELAYVEAKGRIRAGDRVWMLGFGSGFKACSVVWKALRDSCLESDNPWADCIHQYPQDPYKK